MAHGARPAGLLDQALGASRGSRRIAFLREVVPDAPGGWCELVRDVAALANSGGGVLIVGVDPSGLPTGWDPSPLLRAGVSVVVDQLAAYTGERFDDVTITKAQKDGQRVAAVLVGARTGSPLVFERAGTSTDADGREREVFARGTTWFRHGARSAPARAQDVARFAKRQEAQIRREVLRNLRRVSSAPTGSQVLVVPPGSAPTTAIERVRLVDDPSAPAVARADYDVTHPHRQKDVVATINARAGRPLVNAHDLLSVRRTHDVDSRDELFHKPRFGSPQYSDAFIDWLIASHRADSAFFDKAKAEYRQRQLDRRAGT